RSQGFDTVVREQKADGPIANLVPELLLDKRLQVRLVINNQDSCGHAVRSTRLSISLRSRAKSIGLVRSASAPRSSAWRLVIGGYHNDRNVRSHSFCFRQKLEPAHPGHIDVRQDENERLVSCVCDALQRRGGGGRKF